MKIIALTCYPFISQQDVGLTISGREPIAQVSGDQKRRYTVQQPRYCRCSASLPSHIPYAAHTAMWETMSFTSDIFWIHFCNKLIWFI